MAAPSLQATDMSTIKVCELPAGALLHQYSRQGAYTDCYVMDVPRTVPLTEYVETFYTTPVFKVERAILGVVACKPATDQQARLLAFGEVSRFSAWTVEGRAADQLMLRDFMGRTRSWLMCASAPAAPATTRLYFGSAVVPKRTSLEGKASFGVAFHALYRFHHLYTHALMRSAHRQLSARG